MNKYIATIILFLFVIIGGFKDNYNDWKLLEKYYPVITNTIIPEEIIEPLQRLEILKSGFPFPSAEEVNLSIEAFKDWELTNGN